MRFLIISACLSILQPLPALADACGDLVKLESRYDVARKRYSDSGAGEGCPALGEMVDVWHRMRKYEKVAQTCEQEVAFSFELTAKYAVDNETTHRLLCTH